MDFLVNNGWQKPGARVLDVFASKLPLTLRRSESTSSRPAACRWLCVLVIHRAFFKTLEDLDGDVVFTQGFADHQDFDKDELHTLAKKGMNMIMTEKDAVK